MCKAQWGLGQAKACTLRSQPIVALQEFKSYVASASSVLRKKNQNSDFNMKSSTLTCWQLNQHNVQDTAPLCERALSNSPALMLSSLLNGEMRDWETCSFWREESLFMLNIAPCAHGYLYFPQKKILKRPSARAGGWEVWGRLTAALWWSPLCCSSSFQSLLLQLANAAWQINKNMNQVSKTNHSAVILHDLHGMNLWTIGES